MNQFCFSLQASVNVRVNMIQRRNGQSQSERENPKPKGRFTGQRLKVLRPDTYRRAVELLAEPRQQVPYDHICRLLRVGEHTLKAIERAESIPIAERKERLRRSAWKLAQLAADQIQDDLLNNRQSPGQKVITFGVMTDKGLLLNDDPTAITQLNIEPGVDLYKRLAELHASIKPKTIQATAVEPVTSQPALPSQETIF
jgi:hypothetical protein